VEKGQAARISANEYEVALCAGCRNTFLTLRKPGERVTCPHCHAKCKLIALPVDNLVYGGRGEHYERRAA